MKHLLSHLFVVGCFYLTNAQTLTQSANEPAPGDKEYTYLLDTSAYASGLPNNVAGSAAVWNFSNLQAMPPKDTTFYSSPSAVPGATAFPGCTVVQEGFLNVYIKSVTTPTTQTEIMGVNSGTLNLSFTNTAVAARFPISYGSSSTDNLAGTYTALGYSGPCTGVITTTADGKGTLNLPDNFSYTNVLRVKSVQTVNLSQGFIPVGTAVQTIYNYYHSSQKFPLLSVNYTSFSFLGGNPTVTGFLAGSASAFVTSIPETQAPEQYIRVYPNPAQNFAHVTLPMGFSEAVTVLLFDIGGKEVLRQVLAPEYGSEHNLSLQHLQKGLYHLVCQNGSMNYSHRLVIE